MRPDFNWSLLDRENLYSMLYSAGRDVVGKRMAVKDLQKILSRHIKSHLPVRVVRRQNDYTQQRGCIYLGGTYYADYDSNQTSRFIEILLCYHPLDEKIRLTEYRWTRLCQLFSDTILHEIIHMRQYRSRNFKCIPGYESTAHYRKQRMDQEYYGHRDEMGAFSFNIACELVDRFGHEPQSIKRYMDSMQSKRHKKTSYHKFLKAFDWDHDHARVKKMKKKIIKQLEYAAIGRPFKTTTHLTY